MKLILLCYSLVPCYYVVPLFLIASLIVILNALNEYTNYIFHNSNYLLDRYYIT